MSGCGTLTHNIEASNVAEQSPWRPMAEAPRDGTAVLLALQMTRFEVGYYDGCTEFPWSLHDGIAVREEACRFWMPIPELPE